MHYLDNASTTPVDSGVADVANESLRKFFANPSSLYAMGADSADVIENARASLASALNCTDKEVIFTSCGSESNNIAIKGACSARRGWANHIVATGFEHPSVHKVCKNLQSTGFETSFVNPEKSGEIDTAKILSAITNKTALLTVMHINNEIGTVADVEYLAKEAKKINSRIAVHVDGVQAFGKLSLNLAKSSIDSYSVSGHKVCAPKGVGALYLRKNYNIEPVFFGGSQENGMRPGTENIAYIAAFGTAANLICKNTFCPVNLKDMFVEGLKNIDGITINSPQSAHASILNFSTNKVKSEVMLHFLESKGVYVSAGSACSKGVTSHTLAAIKCDKKCMDTAIRVSFGRQNTEDDVKALLNALKEGLKTLVGV